MFLSLVDFQTIQQGVEDENIFIGKYDNFKFSKFITAFTLFFFQLADVIGEVTDLGGLETVLCSGKQRKKIEFSLTDLV